MELAKRKEQITSYKQFTTSELSEIIPWRPMRSPLAVWENDESIITPEPSAPQVFPLDALELERNYTWGKR